MCTVIIHVSECAEHATRMLAVRDEDPTRPWDAPGPWWPDEYPEVIGVRDRRANGAWLAEDSPAGRLAVILNRDVLSVPDGSLESRGGIVLASVSGESLPQRPRTAGFNLVEVAGPRAWVTIWDGLRLRRQQLEPGVHMISHDEVDDPRTARIVRWLPDYRELTQQQGPEMAFEQWAHQWVAVLSASSALGPFDDRAIIRDNHPHGYPTMSLLVCVAEIRAERVQLASAVLPEPGVWAEAPFVLA